MSNNLQKHIEQQIQMHGPMDVGTFIATALGHPQWGYYMKQDPLGVDGDFTTASEISQMFGELLGAWVVDVWTKLGQPSPFLLLECGPGRGTLMADLLRATKAVPGFHDAMQIHLMETSPTLKAKQKTVLAGYTPQWHDTLNSLPSNAPLILLANEFLDALPVRQLQKVGLEWQERVIAVNDNQALTFGLRPAGPDLMLMIPPTVKFSPDGSVFELSPVRDFFVRNVCNRLENQGGVALFSDYGHDKSAPGETLQAVKNHAYVPVLENVGDVDLTTHVDFGALAVAAGEEGMSVNGPAEQGAFLKALGIKERADALMQTATPGQQQDIQTGLDRLISSTQMGRLFKMMALRHDKAVPLSGF